MTGELDLERGLVSTSAGYIHYRAAGSGMPVLVLHINQQSSALSIELVSALASKCRAIALDYPGHGASDHVIGNPTLEDYAGWIRETIDRLALGRVCVVGEAVGAAIAIELACSHPGVVDRIVLVNCPCYPDSSIVQRAQKSLSGGARPQDASGFPVTRTLEHMVQHDAIHSPMRPSQSWMDRINVAQLEAGRDRWQAVSALHRYDISGRLGCVQQPVLLLMGEHFQYTEFMAGLESRMQKGRCEIVPNARFCMSWECSDYIARRTIEFIS